MTDQQPASKLYHQQEMVDGPRGLQIFRQAWLPEGETKALVVLVHGLAEHSGRYQHVVKDLNKHNYAVYGLDHLGHGKSQGDRCCVVSFADYRQPLHTLICELKQKNPSTPIYLLGHSMGGLICASYLLDHQDLVAGAILSAPAILNNGEANLLTMIKLVFYLLVAPNKGLLQLDASGVSRNPDVVQAYLDDPLVFKGPLPAKLLLAFSQAMAQVRKNAGGINVPMLLLQGNQDRLVNPEGAQLLYDRIGSEDKSLERYPDSYHEILNEEEYPQIRDRIIAWLDQHVGL